MDHFTGTSEPLSRQEKTWLEEERRQWDEADRNYNALKAHADAMAEALKESHAILQWAGPNGPRAVMAALANQEALDAYRKWLEEGK